MITYTPTLDDIEHIVTICAYVVTIASAIANLLPHPEKAEGILGKVSKVLNFIALNLKKIEKE